MECILLHVDSFFFVILIESFDVWNVRNSEVLVLIIELDL